MLKEKILNNDDESQEMFQSLILSFHQEKENLKKIYGNSSLSQSKEIIQNVTCMYVYFRMEASQPIR